MCGAKKPQLLSTNKGTLILNLNTVQYMDMKKTIQHTYSLMQKNPNKPTPINLEKKTLPTVENGPYNQSALLVT